MFETYPKGSKHPSQSVGEQDGKDSWDGRNKVEYKNTTVKDTVYEGDRVNTKHCTGGEGSANGPDFPKKREKFDSERHVGK